MFRGHTVYEHFKFGNFYDYYGVPDAWGFLLFCAAWTFLGVIFLLITGISFANHALIATVFGALEWLLFVITTILTIKLVFNSTRRAKTSTTSPAIPI